MARKPLPLKMLQTLEAVVRLDGVSNAARELGVTHGAVSRQIAALEDWLGRALFERDRGRLRPLDETREFVAVITDGFERMDAAMGRVATARRRLKVFAHATFAMHWLVPRLEQFYALHPDIDVHVQTRQTGEDPALAFFDVAIMRGSEQIGNWESASVLQETLTLLTTRRHAETLAARGVAALLGETFAVSDTRPGETERWLEAARLPPLQKWRVRRFGHFHTALMAVLNGQGVAVGPIELTAGQRAEGSLAAPFPQIVAPGPRHVAFIDPQSESYPMAKRFVLWLGEAANAAERGV
ncbi:LysR substrate-binding domain-containing protein [Methylosinus sporium]|uniref:LysR substrate-binding domain-containing protein n=1 Tax=Methylosinus sporium TaxID=428 RepID=UPI00383A1017